MLLKVLKLLGQVRQNTRTEGVWRLIDRKVDASRGRGGHGRVSSPPYTRDVQGSCTRRVGGSGGGRGTAAGKDLPRVYPEDGDHPEDLRAGQPSEGDAGGKAAPSGLRREGRV
jgi:hypothetical protein